MKVMVKPVRPTKVYLERIASAPGGFEYRIMMLVIDKRRKRRGNPKQYMCVAIGTRHLKELI